VTECATPSRASSSPSALPDLGIEHGDGWFALTAALSETISARAPSTRVRQCKAEFASYRLHLDGGDAFCAGAIQAAETTAVRVSEVSGRAGRPMVRRPPFTRVLAAAEADGWQAIPGVPPLPASVDALRARHRAILADAAITGWLDGVPSGSVMHGLREGGPDFGPSGSDEALGAASLLQALLSRVGSDGTVGPVDDEVRKRGAS
jgi:hypothetical protein